MLSLEPLHDDTPKETVYIVPQQENQQHNLMCLANRNKWFLRLYCFMFFCSEIIAFENEKQSYFHAILFQWYQLLYLLVTIPQIKHAKHIGTIKEKLVIRGLGTTTLL